MDAHDTPPGRALTAVPGPSEALLGMLSDLPGLEFEDGRFKLPSRSRCMGYQNCCECAQCERQAKLIAERGFTADGKIKPAETARQPWQARPAA